MHAAWPIGSFAALVTVKTDGIVLFCGPARIVWSERNDATDAEPTDRRCFADEGRDGPHRCVFRAFGLLRSEARVVARDIINRALVKRGENPIGRYAGRRFFSRIFAAGRLLGVGGRAGGWQDFFFLDGHGTGG